MSDQEFATIFTDDPQSARKKNRSADLYEKMKMYRAYVIRRRTELQRATRENLKTEAVAEAIRAAEARARRNRA